MITTCLPMAPLSAASSAFRKRSSVNVRFAPKATEVTALLRIDGMCQSRPNAP
jgi:hypothetical protein